MTPLDRFDAQPWLDLARADLAVADLIMREARATPEMHGLVCFHAQQAAEKALKGVLVSLGLPLPRSHDLVLLVERLPNTRDKGPLLQATAALNEYGVGPRYPGALLVPGPSAAAERARADAQMVWSWALAELDSRPPE